MILLLVVVAQARVSLIVLEPLTFIVRYSENVPLCLSFSCFCFVFLNKMFSLTSVMKCFTESLLRVSFLASSAKHLSRQVMWTLRNYLPERTHSLKYTNKRLIKAPEQ